MVSLNACIVLEFRPDIIPAVLRRGGYTRPIIKTQATYEQLRNPSKYHIREIDTVYVRGKENAVTIYEVFDNDNDKIKELKIKTMQTFNTEVALYKQSKWHDALDQFTVYFGIIHTDGNPQKDIDNHWRPGGDRPGGGP
uniref:Adenylate/guanylate cyclase n=1 Tax=uncultured Nitrospirae bacterium MY3-5B TaxID=798578 RepID=D9MP15_9BACT|nr:adenylate/guanylate cyclase [uncultured Nitrospirae bacterium MY3-5B]